MALPIGKPFYHAGQFAKQLESRPIAYWKFGIHAGEPKICKLCPEFVRVSSRSRHHRLCPKHIREFNAKSCQQTTARRRAKRAAAVLGISPTKTSKPLSSCPIRAQKRDYEGLFGHLSPAEREIAFRELQDALTRHPDPPKHKYASIVARCTLYAKHGGRYAYMEWLRGKQKAIGYWRKQVAEGTV